MPPSTMPAQTDLLRTEDASNQPVIRLLALVVILLAFALRAHHLDYQSLWSDEGISLLRAAQPLDQLWRNMPVEHVPGYFLLVHLWMRILGDADFALRYLSLLPGVFAVALMLRTGRDLGSSRAGLIAAALLATGAFQVWYAQEVRMYSWLLASGLFSTWCLWLLFTRPPTVAVWIGYVLSTTVTIYLHYFGFLVPLVHTVVALLWLVTRRSTRAFVYWLVAGASVFVLFLPWSLRALNLFGFTGWRAPIDPNRIPWLLLQTYTGGETMPEPWIQWLPWLYLATIMLGAAAWYRRKAEAGIFLTTVAVCAVLFTWLLVTRQPDFHVRYTIFVSAPLILLSSGGIASLDPAWWNGKADRNLLSTRMLARTLPWLILGLLVTANGAALNRLYFDESVHKPDFRSAAMHIQQNLRPGDIVLVDGPNPELVFEHYYDGPAPVYDLRSLEGLSDKEIDRTLQKLTGDAGRAWELLYFKSPGPVQVWLATHGWPATPTYHNGIRVQLVGLQQESPQVQAMNIAFGDALELVSAEVDSAGPYAAGDLIRISTNWFTHARAPEYKFSMRLVDAAGEEVLAEDYVPQNWFAPTNVWVVGQPAKDQRGLWLPTDLAPEPHRVTLRLYDPYSGMPVETTAGIDVPIADILVEDGPASGE